MATSLVEEAMHQVKLKQRELTRAQREYSESVVKLEEAQQASRYSGYYVA